MSSLKGSFTNYVKVVIVGSVGLKTPNDIAGGFKTPVGNEHTGYFAPHFIHYPRVSVSQIRGQDNEPSGLTANAPVPCAFLYSALSLRLVIHLYYFIYTGIHIMIYTFIIANKNKLAELNTSRKISVCADTEQQARASLNGLPLLFVSQTPNGRAI
jgi:hypothetical protein